MNLTTRRISARLVLALAAIPFTTHCGLMPRLPGTACPDMSNIDSIDHFDFAVNFRLRPDVAAKVKAGVAAAAAMNALSKHLDAELLDACGAIAKDLGDPTAFATGQAACEGATRAIAGTKAKLGANAAIHIDVNQPDCEIDANAVGACLARCGDCNVRCDAEIQTRATCTPAHLELTITGATDDQTAVRLRETLERNLPRILAVGVGMAKGIARVAQGAVFVVQGGQAAIQTAMADKWMGGALLACVMMPLKDAISAAAAMTASVHVAVDVQASASASGKATSG